MRLFLIMLIVTSIEVILISKMGELIGFFATFLIIIATAILGSWQLRKQWRFVIGKLQTLQSEPSQALLEALVLLISGVLLITPGFLTDIVGFLGLIPVVRERFVVMMRQRGWSMMQGGHFRVYRGNQNNGNNSQSSPFSTAFGNRTDYANHHTDDIIEGEFERKDR